PPLCFDTSYFLDLTYYRTSLKIDFSTSVIREGNFRQSLKKDLNELYSQLKINSLICGNQSNDPYVAKVLEAFSQENQLTIIKKGSFWFVRKRELPFPLLPSTLEPLGPHDCAF